MLKDLPYAIRMLRKNPWFTAIAVVSLAIEDWDQLGPFSVWPMRYFCPRCLWCIPFHCRDSDAVALGRGAPGSTWCRL
jgi:hypothetical protein